MASNNPMTQYGDKPKAPKKPKTPKTPPKKQRNANPMSPYVRSNQADKNRQEARTARSQKRYRDRATAQGQLSSQPVDLTKVRQKKGKWVVQDFYEGQKVGWRYATPTEVKRYKNATNWKPAAAASPRRGSGGSGSGSAAAPPDSTPATPSSQPIGAPNVALSNTLDATADKFFNDLYNPARREIERQRQYLDTQKAASQTAWNKFNEWNEAKRAEAAGVMSTQQAENAKVLAASRQQADENIRAMVEQARGSLGGSDFGAATGADVTASGAADQAAAGAAAAESQSAIDKINAQRILDDQRVNQALSAGATADINASFNKASEALAQRNAALEANIAQAKLDRFYKDRQYTLDTAAANWLMQKQGYQLGQSDRQIKAAEDAAAARGAAAGVDAAAERNKLVTASHKQALEWLPSVVTKYGKENFTELPTHEQGQAMQDMAKALKASYGNTITEQEAQRIMASIFSQRFSNPALNGAKGGRSAIVDFRRVWNS